MKKIKLLVDGHWFDHQHESAAIFLKGLYTQLQHDSDFDVFIAANNVEKLKHEFNHSEKITYLKLASPSKFYRLTVDLPRIIKENKIDIAHYQYISPFIKTTREIVTIHDLLYKDFSQHFPIWYRLRNDVFFKRSAKRADLITSVSNYSIAAIAKHFDIPIAKIHLTSNGISEDYFSSPEFIDVKEKHHLSEYVLCVSRIEPRKNHLFLVRAYCELTLWKKGIQLVLVGREDLPVKELEAYLVSLPQAVRKNIIRLENISLSELKNLYVQAKVVVYPSLGEGFGIPPLEAAALKASVLCSNATAMSDFSFFGDSLFNPYDLEELKSKLMEKLTLKDDQGKQFSEEIRARYNWSTIAGTFSKEIKRLF